MISMIQEKKDKRALLTNVWYSMSKIARTEIIFLFLAGFILFVAAFLFIQGKLFVYGDLNKKLKVLSLITLGTVLVLDSIRIRVKIVKLKREWFLHIILPTLISLAAIPVYVLLDYSNVAYAYVVYAAGAVWLLTVIFKSSMAKVKEITPEKALLDINRKLNEKIKVAHELFAKLFEIETSLDLGEIKNMLLEYENVVHKNREKLELMKNRLTIKLLEIADSCTCMAEIGNKSKGLNPILEHIHKVLETEMNIVPMEIDIGKDTFDPRKHEIKDFEYREDFPENTIIKVLRDGYININSGEIERIAFVRVVKHEKR